MFEKKLHQEVSIFFINSLQKIIINNHINKQQKYSKKMTIINISHLLYYFIFILFQKRLQNQIQISINDLFNIKKTEYIFIYKTIYLKTTIKSSYKIKICLKKKNLN